MIQTPNPDRFSFSLILAALLLFFPLLSCGGHQSPIDKAASSVCEKAAQCSNYHPSGSEMNECKQAVAPALQILPDPESFTTCMKQLDCATLNDDTADNPAILACLNLDMTSIHCNSDQKTLHACTNNAVCSDIDCTEACSYVGWTYMYCAADSSRGHDVCWCQM